MANIYAINISRKKGTQKRAVPEAELRKDLGIVGDAHAGPGDRQVSLLAKEDIDAFSAGKMEIAAGAFGENIITKGLEVFALQIGDKLQINNAILEISKIGKECHAPCIIGKTMGECIMPKKGVFARVLKEDTIKTGDTIVLI